MRKNFMKPTAARDKIPIRVLVVTFFFSSLRFIAKKKNLKITKYRNCILLHLKRAEEAGEKAKRRTTLVFYTLLLSCFGYIRLSRRHGKTKLYIAASAEAGV